MFSSVWEDDQALSEFPFLLYLLETLGSGYGSHRAHLSCFFSLRLLSWAAYCLVSQLFHLYCPFFSSLILNGHGFGWTLGVGDGQGGLACCGSWGRKESDTTERLNWTELNWRQEEDKSVPPYLTKARSGSFMYIPCISYLSFFFMLFFFLA